MRGEWADFWLIYEAGRHPLEIERFRGAYICSRRRVGVAFVRFLRAPCSPVILLLA